MKKKEPELPYTNFTFRIGREELKKLKAEAEAEGRSIANYLKLLIDTHPGRKKIKGSHPGMESLE